MNDPEERERILAEIMLKEPWYLRELAPMCVGENKMERIEGKVGAVEIYGILKHSR